MPAVTVEAPQRSEQMRQALKIHITNERQRKKQEQEADAEEERRRKERERQQKQDVMTLGETRDQISSLESELSQLKSEKHQLFLQLKKVLNEDDNRRRLTKESSVCTEAMTVAGSYSASGPSTHSQLFLPLPTRSPLYKVPTAAPTQNILPNTNGPTKRTHSPSPPPSGSPYHGVHGYKPPPSIPNYNPPKPKSEETSRRSGDSRAVLWNKYDFYAIPPNTKGMSRYEIEEEVARRDRDYRNHLIEKMNTERMNINSIKPTIPYVQNSFERKYNLRPETHNMYAVNGMEVPKDRVLPWLQSPMPFNDDVICGITSGSPIRPSQPQTMSYPPPPPPSGAHINQNRTAMPERLVYTQPGILTSDITTRNSK